MKRNILFIINPISGGVSKAQVPKEIARSIDSEQFDYTIKETTYAGEATELAHQATEKGVDIVVAVGGDGTVNEVARALVHTPTALAIIPMGSGNGLARHLLLPMNVRKCIEIINQAIIRPLDYGMINEYPFFCTCGMGFDAFVSMKFAEDSKRGPITYVQKVLEEGRKYHPETYEITDEEGTQHYKAFLLSVANASQYGNNFYIAPQASMSDGLLDVVILEPFDLIDAPLIPIEMLNKTLDKSTHIKTFSTKHIHVHRSQPGVIHYDGEPVMTGEDVDTRLIEKGINIVVNPFSSRQHRRPNAIQTAASELINQLTAIREDIQHQTHRGVKLAKMIQKKIEKNLLT